MNRPPSANMYHLWPLSDKIELKRKTQLAIDDLFSQMTDTELEILAEVGMSEWPPDYALKWSGRIFELEAICHQAERAGINIDEL